MNESESIEVVIVDDHDMLRRGLRAFLRAYEDLELVGEARGGREALALCERARPDVVLMDLVMPDMGGVEATRLIRERYPETQVIALTSFEERDLVQSTLEAGAIGYLLKSTSAEDLARAIRAAAAGKPMLGPEATQVLISSAAQPAPPGDELTDRELEVLGLVAAGLNNPAIGEELHISRSTVKKHVSNILAKLGVSTRTEAATQAVQHKIIDLNE